MTDHFTVLNEPRRPWLDEAALKQKFLRLSSDLHPDRVHHLNERERASAQEHYLKLNAAYHCLREPKERLRHLLELELGAVPKEIQAVSGDMMELFLAIGEHCRRADSFLKQKEEAVSPLLQAQFHGRAHEEAELLAGVQQEVLLRRESLIGRLRRIDAEWDGSTINPESRTAALCQIEDLYRLLSYFDRWVAQLRERIVRLSF